MYALLINIKIVKSILFKLFISITEYTEKKLESYNKNSASNLNGSQEFFSDVHHAKFQKSVN